MFLEKPCIGNKKHVNWTKEGGKMNSAFYNLDDVARISHKSQKTIRRAIHAGFLNAVKIQNHFRISKTDFDNWKSSKNFNEQSEAVKNSISKPDDINWIDITKEWKKDGWKNPKQRNGLNFIDLFSGAGGLSCGLVEAGFTPLASVEIMPQAVDTYKLNFIDKKGFKENITSSDIRKDEVKQALYEQVKGKKIDLIVGGYPCQGFSMAGYRVMADPRNSLYLEMLKIVDHLKPAFIVMENVEGLRSMLNGNVEKKIIEDYEKIGYKINVTVLNSADYGAPQIRKRVIFIGNNVHATNYHPKPLLDEEHYVTIGDALEKYRNVPEDKSINHIFTKSKPITVKRIKTLKIGHSLYKNYSDAWKKPSWNKPSPTIKENHGGVLIHPILNRMMTPRELAALQTFPDDFIFCGSKKWQLVQIGNAVPPTLGKAIGLAISRSMKNWLLKHYYRNFKKPKDLLSEDEEDMNED